MSALQNVINRTFRCVSAVLALLLITEISTFANASQQSPTLANDISLAREFLRSLYPDLSGKKYTLVSPRLRVMTTQIRRFGILNLLLVTIPKIGLWDMPEVGWGTNRKTSSLAPFTRSST
jgi:hypothetical protein